MPADSRARHHDAKANLDHIYDQPDPRAYYRALHKLDYATPNAGKPLFLKLIGELRRLRDKSARVLDLGCSYGVNGALLKHNMTMGALYEHCARSTLRGLGAEAVMAHDRRFFAERETPHTLEIIGLDRAHRAVAFALETGLIDEGIVADLETEPLPDAAASQLADIDLITSTGCIGYVTKRTFERLLPAVTTDQAPWIANFVLRLWNYAPIEATLSDWGYVTQKLESRTFKQRRFVDDEERTQVLEQLRERGIDPAGKEADGHLHAEFFVSRPAAEARGASLSTLLAG